MVVFVIGVVVLLACVLVFWLSRKRGAARKSNRGDDGNVMAESVVSDSKDRVVAVLRLDLGLAEQLRYHAARAFRFALVPVMEIKADWCPPSLAFGMALEHPLLKEALSGSYLLRTELEFDATGDEAVEWFKWVVFPAFYALDIDGRPTGLRITGALWSEDTPEGMAPHLREFIARANGK